MLTVGSLFSGIGGFDLGFERAGMKVVWQAEKDKYARSVLQRHWPDVRLYEDVKDVDGTSTAVDLICGGFPCQDVSVAGKRAGLAGERSGLWFEFLRILRTLKPEWVVIENVPGLLSSNRGRDFAVILYGLGECGYQSAWRVLDAQYWGVAQRRRRVFIVANLRDGRAAEVLFERDGGEWNTPARKETGQGIAGMLGAGAGRNRGLGLGNEADFLVPTAETYRFARSDEYRTDAIAPAIASRDYKSAKELVLASTVRPEQGGHLRGDGADNIVIYDMQQITSMTNQSNPQPGDPAPTLSPQQKFTVVSPTYMIKGAAIGRKPESGPQYGEITEDVSYTLNTSEVHAVNRNGVRRLTPVECERLQGFPDGWTAGQSDSQRYKELGNAVAVPVMEWIGKRIVTLNSK